MRRPLYLSDRMIEALKIYHKWAEESFANEDALFPKEDFILPVQDSEDILDLHKHIGEYIQANAPCTSANIAQVGDTDHPLFV